MAAHERKYDSAALDERQSQIVGKPPRVNPCKLEDLTGDARDLIVGLRAAIGTTTGADVPEFFLTMVKHPSIFRRQLEMGTSLFNGAISPRQRELAVLRVGWLLRAPYEWGEHVDIAKRYGVTPDEVERTTIGSCAAGWSAFDAAILKGVEELIADQMISDPTWTALTAEWNETQLIEFPMMVGQYIANALVQNTLRLRLAKDNPGLSHR